MSDTYKLHAMHVLAQQRLHCLKQMLLSMWSCLVCPILKLNMADKDTLQAITVLAHQHLHCLFWMPQSKPMPE